MEITAKMVAELREMTGAGMMDCKKALVEANGDMNKAFLQSIIPAPVISLNSATILAVISIIYSPFCL